MAHDINAQRNQTLRHRVNELIGMYGVKASFIAQEIGMDYGLFCRWTNGKKNYVERNLNKIESHLHTKYKNLA